MDVPAESSSSASSGHAGGRGEMLCLKWEDFGSHFTDSFRNFREDAFAHESFFDVSLAAAAADDDEDHGQQHLLQAHKVILSACSPFFRRVLSAQARVSPMSGLVHPVIYLRGVRARDLRNVLDFMYRGEVNVAQDDLNSFLAAAADLQVKGLTEGDSVGGGEEETGRQDGRGEVKKRKRPSTVDASPSSSKKSFIQRPRPRPPPPPSYPRREDSPDDVVEVVKEEYRPAAPAASSTFADDTLDAEGGDGYGDGGAEFGAADEEYAAYDDDAQEGGGGGDYTVVDEERLVAAGGEEPAKQGAGRDFARVKKSSSLEDLLRHKSAPIADGFLCLVCGAKLKNKGALISHFRYSHAAGDDGSDRRHRCPVCGKIYKNRNSMGNHMSLYHKDVKGLDLKLCAI